VGTNHLTNPQMHVLGAMPNLRNLAIMTGNQLGLPLPPWMQTKEDRPVLNYMRDAVAVRGFHPPASLCTSSRGEWSVVSGDDRKRLPGRGAPPCALSPCPHRSNHHAEREASLVLQLLWPNTLFPSPLLTSSYNPPRARRQAGEQPRKEISFINVGFPHYIPDWYLAKMFPNTTQLLDRGTAVPHPPMGIYRVPGTRALPTRDYAVAAHPADTSRIKLPSVTENRRIWSLKAPRVAPREIAGGFNLGGETDLGEASPCRLDWL
jgi:hypothetical protein